jgi:hypothetical protein
MKTLLDFYEIIKTRLTMDVKPNVGQTTLLELAFTVSFPF